MGVKRGVMAVRIGREPGKKYKKILTEFVRCANLNCALHKQNQNKETKMEQQIKDGLNFILGAVTSVKTEAETVITKINSDFQTLAAKGAQDQSELSVNLRKYLQDGVSQLEALVGKVNATVEETKQKVASATNKG